MLRKYQFDLVAECERLWGGGAANIIPVLPTGGGKTRMMAHIAKAHQGAGVAIAHRSVLIGQISGALAQAGVPHDIVASKAVIKTIVGAHIEDVGRSWYNPSADWKVASVDTLPGRVHSLGSWVRKTTLGFVDEAHHVLSENKWGRECLRFTNPAMRWLLPTATPERSDGKGLGRNADGIVDAIAKGPSMRWLIDNGYLTNYRIRAPLPADLDLADVKIGANGEYNQAQMRRAVHRSAKIIGDVVNTYLTNTPGKLGICFAVDVEHARALTASFVAAGVAAELITAEHSEEQRREILRRYKQKKTLVLLNVDLFGEGFDLPAIEVVMFARPTASYGLFVQQWGRGLRVAVGAEYMRHWEQYTPEQRLAIIAASEKPVAHIHDHVGNVLHFFGPPDAPRDWSLDRRSARASKPSDAIPLRVCLGPTCNHPYERFLTACPMCGLPVPDPVKPTAPEQVDGDITLYTPEMLARMFGVGSVQAALDLRPKEFCAKPPNCSIPVALSLEKHHKEKLAQQQQLAEIAPLVMPPTLPERERMRKFYLQYGVDIVSARLLGGADTRALVERIQGTLRGN